MSSAVGVNHLTSRLKVTNFACVPGDTASHYAGWLDMRDFTHLLAAIVYAVRVGHLTAFSLYASTKSDGSDTPVKIRDYQGADVTKADAVGDQLVIECSAQELEALGSKLRYVSVAYTASSASDVLA